MRGYENSFTKAIDRIFEKYGKGKKVLVIVRFFEKCVAEDLEYGMDITLDPAILGADPVVDRSLGINPTDPETMTKFKEDCDRLYNMLSECFEHDLDFESLNTDGLDEDRPGYIFVTRNYRLCYQSVSRNSDFVLSWGNADRRLHELDDYERSDWQDMCDDNAIAEIQSLTDAINDNIKKLKTVEGKKTAREILSGIKFIV